MSKLIFPLLLVLLLSVERVSAADMTPSDVYAQAERIEQQTLDLQKQLGITGTLDTYPTIKSSLSARHIWAKTYMLLTKINLFREQKGLPVVHPVALEPMLNLPCAQNWAQTLRILTEIETLKQALNLKMTPPPATPVVTGKRPVDVYNKLNDISMLWNLLIGGQITPPYVYAEAMRLNDDITFLLQAHGVLDNALPPVKIDNATPADVLDATFTVLGEIQRLQQQVGLDTVDLNEFRTVTTYKQDVRPQDVFNMVSLVIAELQVLKAKQGMKHTITPIAQFYGAKKHADVAQVLGYAANRLHLLNLRQGD